MNTLLGLLNTSNKIAIALLLAGLVFLLDKTFGFLPFPIPDALAGWLTVASVLGACVLFANIVAWLYSVAGQGGKGWKAWTVMSRLDELTNPKNSPSSGSLITLTKLSGAVASMSLSSASVKRDT